MIPLRIFFIWSVVAHDSNPITAEIEADESLSVRPA